MINTIFEFLEEWSSVAAFIIGMLVFFIGYFTRYYEDKKRTSYSLTEAELASIYRNLWDKGRYNGKAKSMVILSKEYLDLTFSIHLNECIKDERNIN